MFCLLQLRGVEQATNTQLQALRSVRVLLMVLDDLRVDLERRLREGRMLSNTELEAIVKACSLHLDDLKEDGNAAPSGPGVIKSREAVRMRARVKPLREVAPLTKSIRLHYIRRYLMWLADRSLLRLDPASPKHESLLAVKDITGGFLTVRMPPSPRRNSEDRRQGLAPRALERLLEVIQPGHPENPWRTATQERNNLLVRWYLKLGLRRSELLVVQVSDIDFASGEVLIARRPIDKEDPRVSKPNVKTNDKLLPLDPVLAHDTHRYVLRGRRGTGRASKNPYLFVATPSGRPLSLSAVNLVFTQLRRKVPELPEDLTPHVLRHTWNDQFSELADKEGYSNAEETKMRSRLQGWSETSGTAATYTRRHVRRKARQASLMLQEQLDVKRGVR